MNASQPCQPRRACATCGAAFILYPACECFDQPRAMPAHRYDTCACGEQKQRRSGRCASCAAKNRPAHPTHEPGSRLSATCRCGETKTRRAATCRACQPTKHDRALQICPRCQGPKDYRAETCRGCRYAFVVIAGQCTPPTSLQSTV